MYLSRNLLIMDSSKYFFVGDVGAENPKHVFLFSLGFKRIVGVPDFEKDIKS